MSFRLVYLTVSDWNLLKHVFFFFFWRGGKTAKWRVVGSSLKSRTTHSSSVRPRLPSAATRPLGRPTSHANQGRNKMVPPPIDADSQVRPRRRAAGADKDAISTGPRCCRAPHAHRAPLSSSPRWRMTWWASIFVQTGAWERPSFQEWVVRLVPDRQPPLPCPTLHRWRVSALRFPQEIHSSDTTHRLFSWSASGTHWSNHGPKALAPGKSRLDRTFFPARWRAPGSDGVSISRIGHHAISSDISRRVCAFLPCGWPPSRERFPVGWLSSWAPYGAERSLFFPPLARTSTALVDTVRYAETILTHWSVSRASQSLRRCCSKWNNMPWLVPLLQRRWFRCWRPFAWRKGKNLRRRWFYLLWAVETERTITGEWYRTQLMRLSRALHKKRPQYEQRHEKTILQYDKARPHFAKLVKTYLETPKWEILPHPTYSPDIASSDCYLFRSMEHGLPDQQFRSYEDIENGLIRG